MGDRRFDFYDWMCIAKCFDFVLIFVLIISHEKCVHVYAFICVRVRMGGFIFLSNFFVRQRGKVIKPQREYETTFKYKKDR